MRSRILFLPECPDTDAFVDLLARASFHLAHVKPETLTFVVAPGLRQSAERVVEDTIVPDGLDATTAEHIRRVSGRVVIVETGTPEAERIGDDRTSSRCGIPSALPRDPGHTRRADAIRSGPSSTWIHGRTDLKPPSTRC